MVDQGGRIQTREHLQGFWGGLCKEVFFFFFFFFGCFFFFLVVFFFFFGCFFFFFGCFFFFLVVFLAVCFFFLFCFLFLFLFLFLFCSFITLLSQSLLLGETSMDPFETQDAFWVLGRTTTKNLQKPQSLSTIYSYFY